MNNNSQENVNEKKQFKRAKKGAWAIVPKQVWLDCSHSELCVYNAISYLQGNNEYTWAGLDIISAESGYSTSACDKAIRSLIKLGWVGRIKQYGKPSKLFVYMDYIPNDETRYKILEAKHKANYEFKQKMKDAKDRKKLTNLQNPNESNLQNLSDTVLQNPSESIYQHHLPTTDYQQKVCANHVVLNNIEETEIIAEPIQKTHPIDIDAKYQQNLIEINNRYDSNLLSLPKFTTDELLDNSDKFLQNLGIGFEFNPRNILNKIYSNLPKDFAIREDKDDIATIKQFIDKYSSVTTAERDAMSKRLYQGIETMVKIYVIKKYGEEFRGKLYPEQLDKNLILYLNCNPNLKYCLSGWSNDVDGVYNEVVRIICKKVEKQKREFYTQWQREISAENAERQYMERELIPEEEKIARRKRTESILRGFRDAGKGNIADDSENPYFGIRSEEEEIELANLRKMTLDLFDAGTRPDPSITTRIEQLLKKIGRG